MKGRGSGAGWPGLAARKSHRGESEMIAVAKQEGNTVRVYDEQNRFLFARTGELQGGGGYTASTVAIREGSRVAVYDERNVFQFAR